VFDRIKALGTSRGYTVTLEKNVTWSGTAGKSWDWTAKGNLITFTNQKVKLQYLFYADELGAEFWRTGKCDLGSTSGRPYYFGGFYSVDDIIRDLETTTKEWEQVADNYWGQLGGEPK